MKIKKLFTFLAVAALMVSCGGTEPTTGSTPNPNPDDPTVPALNPDNGPILQELPADPQPAKFENFTRRVMILDHTGQQCGYCPGVMKILESIDKNDKHKDKVVIVAAHNYGSDQMNCTLATTARSKLKIGGSAPYVTYDHRTDKEYSQAGSGGTVSTFMARADKIIENFPAKAGISATVKEDGDNIVVYVGVKIAEAGKYTIGAWILEDGEVAYQSGGGDKFTHNHILRGGKNNNDIWGDALDTDKDKVFAKGDKVGKIITIKKPAKLKDINKTRVAIFLCTPDKEGAAKSYVNNIIQCEVGGSVPFSYTE